MLLEENPFKLSPVSHGASANAAWQATLNTPAKPDTSSNPSGRDGLFEALLRTGSTVDLSKHYTAVVPVAKLAQLARIAKEANAHLVIPGSHINACDLKTLAALGGAHLTVAFGT